MGGNCLHQDPELAVHQIGWIMKHLPPLLSKLYQWFIVLGRIRRHITFLLLLILLISCHFEGAAAQRSTDADVVQTKKDSDPTEKTRIVVEFNI